MTFPLASRTTTWHRIEVQLAQRMIVEVIVAVDSCVKLISRLASGCKPRYFLPVISFAASAAREKSKIELAATSPFRPAVAPSIAI